jgi:hypothetical protein
MLAAQAQYDLNSNVIVCNGHIAEASNVAVLVQIALCQFDGHSADKVQLLLSPNASATLDSLNRQDERG